MSKNRIQLFCSFLIVLFLLTPVTTIIGKQFRHNNDIAQDSLPFQTDVLSPNSFTSDGKYHLQVNFTIQKVFVGFNPATLNLPILEANFPPYIEIIREDSEFDYTINYTINYDYVICNNQTYSQTLLDYATLNSQFTNTSKINDTALILQHGDAQPRSIFLDQEGYAINASAVDDWIEANPYVPAPQNGYRFYILNFSSLDASDHSIEHWFEFDNMDIDSNQTISWFRLEWDNDLNPDTKFPYPGFDSKYGKTYILDPSAFHWFSRWEELYYGGSLSVDPYSYVTKDLDDIQRENDLVSNPSIMAYYLRQWLEEIIELMLSDGMGAPRYRDSNSVSVQTLILNGDDKPLEDIEWVTSEERIYNELNGPMPFIDWNIDVRYDNLTNYPEIEQAFHDSLISNISNFWRISSSLIWDNIHHRRHKFFDLDAADEVITAVVLIRSDMVMDVGGRNFTGLGGDSNVVILKSRERYFESDEVTPRSGISGVLVHEVGHNLGFGHPHGPGAYCRGTMTYYNTRHEFNQFYVNILRRGQVSMRYCQVQVDFMKDKQRYGLNSPIMDINFIHEDIKLLLDDTLLYFNQMDYLSAANSINLAREKIAELQALRELYHGRIRNVGKNTEGMSETVVVENDVAYMVTGQQLRIYDVSTPTSPLKLSNLELPYYATDIYVKDDLAYLSQIDYGFSIVDISDTANPAILSTVTEVGYVSDISVVGDFAYISRPYVGDYDYAIGIYDISTPSNPIFMNKLLYGQGVRRIVTSDTHLYVAFRGEYPNGTKYSAIKIFNIQDPYVIFESGEFLEPEISITFELFLDNNILYAAQITGSGNYLNIYNVASPSNPTYIANFAADDIIVDIHVVGNNYAYLACYEAGLIIVNVATLTESSRIDTDCYLWGVFVSGNYAYLGDLASLKIVDVSSETMPSVIYTIETTPVTSSTVVFYNNHAFVGDTTKGFAVYDVNDNTNPIKINYTLISDGVVDLEISGDYLYVLGHPFYLHVFDISDPANPIELSEYNCTSRVWGFTVEGNNAFIGTYERFRIIDVTDKANPTEIGGLDTLPYIYDIAIDGNYAYLACEADGLEIIDISTITNPTLVYDLDIEENAYVVTTVGSYAIIGHGSGITTVDISTPSLPVVNYDYNMFDKGISKFEKQGDLIYAASFDFGIHIYNVSNPARPIEIGYNDSIVYVQDVTYSEGAIYAGNYKTGLWIFDHDLDSDLLYSIDEVAFGSNPFMYDTDFDGFSDYEEWLHGTDPNDPNDYPGKNKNILIGSIIIGVSYGFGFTVMTLVLIRRRKS